MSKPESVADGKYSLLCRIGAGSFGEVFLGINSASKEKVAVKLERVLCSRPLLEKEFYIYQQLVGGVGIPKIHYFGTEGDFNVLVMELLGPSLEDLFNFCSRGFSSKTILMLADQMISRLEFVHSKHCIHRDLKPENFCMGNGRRSSRVFLIDYGLASGYRNPKSLEHIVLRNNLRCLTGTARYCSVNVHMGIEPSRRDDMVSMGFILLYFARGRLPWQGFRGATTQQVYEKIGEMKMSMRIEEMCQGLTLSNEFMAYIKYCRRLRFDQAPDYAHLRQMFRTAFLSLNYQHDYLFDWTLKERKENALPSTLIVS